MVKLYVSTSAMENHRYTATSLWHAKVNITYYSWHGTWPLLDLLGFGPPQKIIAQTSSKCIWCVKTGIMVAFLYLSANSVKQTDINLKAMFPKSVLLPPRIKESGNEERRISGTGVLGVGKEQNRASSGSPREPGWDTLPKGNSPNP